MLAIAKMFSKFTNISIISSSVSDIYFKISNCDNTIRIKAVDSNSLTVNSSEHISCVVSILRGTDEIPFNIKYTTNSSLYNKTKLHSMYSKYMTTLDNNVRVYNIPYNMIEFASYDFDNVYISINNDNISIIGKYNIDNSDIDYIVLSMGKLNASSGNFCYAYTSYCMEALGYLLVSHDDGNHNNFGNMTGYQVMIMAGKNIDETWCSLDSKNMSYSENVRVSSYYVAVHYTINKVNYKACYSTLINNGRDIPKLPSYDKVANWSNRNSSGCDTNTLNGISLILPTLFYVRACPDELNIWSYISSTKDINTVNMYNMSSMHIIQEDYPVSGDRYVCILPYARRKYTYSGIAIKLTNKLDITEDDNSVIPSVQ